MDKVILPPGTRGKNKRGICLHKASKSRTKRAKRQYVPGYQPDLVTMYGRREA